MNTDIKNAAKKYCKDFKYKLEDIYEDMFIISKISKSKVSRCTGKSFDNWQKNKYRYFEVIQFMPDNDCVTIKTNLGGKMPVNSKVLFNSLIIQNLQENRI